MSKSIDNRVVEMQFDNKQFEQGVHDSISSLNNLKNSLKLEDAAKGFKNLDKASNSVSFDGLARSVDNISNKFSALGIMGITVLQNLTNSALNAGKRIASAFTIDPIKSGFHEYETQMNAVQTILANTESKGTTLGQVNAALNELNTYADKTIYNFTEMTRNIGTFTAAGVDLKTSVAAIKGISNLAAMSGSTSQQASTAMYQLSQAIAAGRVNLQDWNSVVNAGMGGQVFQNALKETAKVMGKTVDESKSFRESISSRDGDSWLTSDVLLATLNEFTGDLSEADLAAQGFTADQIQNIMKLADTANKAATQVKTVSQLFDTLKEAVGSGWTQTWQIIVGDFGEAREFLTEVSDTLSQMVNDSATSRNNFLTSGLSTQWKQALNLGISNSEDYIDEISKVAANYGYDVAAMTESAGSFEKSLKKGWLTSGMMSEALDNLTTKLSDMTVQQRKEAGYSQDQYDALVKLNGEAQASATFFDKFTKNMTIPSGRENLIDALKNSFEGLMSVVKPVREAFRDIFPEKTGDQLYAMTVGLKNFTEKLKLGAETANNLKRTFKGFFAVLDIGKQILSGFVGMLKSVIAHLAPAGKAFLGVTGDLGDFLVSIDETLKKSGAIQAVFQGLAGVLEWAADVVKGCIIAISSAFKGAKNIDLSGFDDLNDRIKARFASLTGLGDWFKKLFSGITGVLSKAWNKIKPILSDMGKGISNALKNFKFSDLTDLIDAGTLAGVGISISKFLNGFKAIPNMLGSLTNTLEAFQTKIKAGALTKIAVAVGLLALSLFTLSMVDSSKLQGGIAAMGALFAELLASMKVLETIAADRKTMNKVKKMIMPMIGFSLAILILAKAVATIGKVKPEEIAKAVLSIVGLIASLTASATVLSKSSGKLIKGSLGLIAFAIAIKILADATTKLSKLKPEEVEAGLISIAGLMGALLLFLKFGKFDKLSFKSAMGILVMSTAIAILAKSFASLGKMKPDAIEQGFAALVGILAALTAFVIGVGYAKNFSSTAAGLVAFSIALLLISKAIKTLGSMDPEALTLGLLGFVTAITMIILAVNLFPKDAPKVGFTLMAIAISMLILSSAVEKLGSMSWENIAKGLVALGGAMAILVIGINALQSAVAGAFSMLIIAAALAILTDVLIKMGSMSWESIAKSLITLAGALVIIGAAGILLGPVSPLILLLGAALIVLGVGLAICGVALNLFSSAGVGSVGVLLALTGALIPLTLLTPALLIVGAALAVFGVGLLLVATGAAVLGSALGVVNQNVPTGVQNLTLLAQTGAQIATFTPQLLAAGAGLLVFGAGALVAAAGSVAAGAGMILLGIGLQQIAAAGTDSFDTLTTITDDLVASSWKLLAAAPGLLAGGGALLTFGAGAVTASAGISGLSSTSLSFSTTFSAMSGSVKGNCSTITTSVSDMVSAVSSTIQNGGSKVMSSTKSVLDSSVSAVKSYRNSFTSAGSYLVDGFIVGINSNSGRAAQAAANMARSASQAARNNLKINSPSKVFEEMGMYVDLGFAKGIAKYASAAQSAAADASESTLQPVQTMTDGLASNHGALTMALQNMTKSASVSVSPTVYSEKTVNVKHSFDTLTVKGVNNKGEFVASADYAVEDVLTQMMRRQNRT